MSLRVDAHVEVGGFSLDVRLEVAAGETLAVLGPNGAGKTTLLRAVAGLVPLRAGRIELDGAVLEDASNGARLPTERRPIGVVFQDYLLFPHMTALDNVAYGLRCRGMSRREARATASDWLARVGLGDRSDARPGALSGGQAQRVALARALAIEPRLLLLDEPLAAVDARTRVEMRRELKRHLASFGGARLLVTHDPLEAMALAQRLVVVEDGRVVQEGSLGDISARPRSRYVAELVGVNLFQGQAHAGRLVTSGGAELMLADALDGEVFAVVHPRAVALYRSRPHGTPRNVWRGAIDGIDAEGERVRVSVGGDLPIVAEVTAEAAAELALVEGGEIWVGVKATEVTAYLS